ncbi:MAG: helix-turn-helix transcriptional regulator, partial [Clostridia bacterium]|nr:helix-turn-helix transcriptional regulator [Clostridia bacterium]
MSIASMIIKLRKTSNLSQEKFAEIFGVSQQSVQKWERGDAIPDLEKIV